MPRVLKSFGTIEEESQVTYVNFETQNLEKTDIIFATMPFGPMTTPSIALSLLQSILQAAGMDSRVLYFTLRFADLISSNNYQFIENSSPSDLIGEWVFTDSLFDQESGSMNRAEDYIDIVVGKNKYPDVLCQNLPELREKTEGFLDSCLETVLAYSPKIVGFTSTFQQQVASLSLAKRIKMHRPETLIVFGGANLEGMPGLEVVRQFPFVDAVVSGEGDKIVADLFRRMLDGKPFSDISGVYTQENIKLGLHLVGTEPENTPKVQDMNSLPYPNYSDFFTAWDALDLPTSPDDEGYIAPRILLETSRGCWWGEKKHCTFCGLNGSGMEYRSKSYQRALDELLHFVELYPGTAISCVDNILDMGYFKDLLPTLSELDIDLNLFYEVKANLRKEQVHLLSLAGIKSIQPGIESFSDRILQLMSKGVSGFQNVQILKWCQEFDVRPYWNILWGFPAETAEDYRYMETLLPQLTHLRPPQGGNSIRLDRFSPNFNFAEEFGFKNVKPYPGYAIIYPTLPKSALFNLAYYFTYEYQDNRNVSLYTSGLEDLVSFWKEEHGHSALFYIDKGEELLLCDTRPNAQKAFIRVKEPARTLYLMCDEIQTMRKLHKNIEQKLYSMTKQAISQALQPLIDNAVMLHHPDKDMFLSLAISLDNYSPTKEVLDRLYVLMHQEGKMVDGQLIVSTQL